MSKEDWGEEKICVERVLPIHYDELNRIKKSSKSHRDRLAAAFYTKKLWPANSTIRIAFLGKGDQVRRTSLQQIETVINSSDQPLKMDPLQKEVANLKSVQKAVKQIVMERLQPIISLKLIFVDNPEDANIRISFNPSGGAWSFIGTDCLSSVYPAPTMNLGWFDVATTIHEFCHALGMIHEHQNPRGNEIKWDEPKVLEWAKSTQGWDRKTVETNIIDRYSQDLINGSTYDPMSIMLYFFPGNLTTNNKGTHMNLRLSGVDVEFLNQMYPNSSVSPEDFYEDNYGENIETSVEESGFFGKSVDYKKVLIVLGIILAILIIGYFVWKWFQRRSVPSRPSVKMTQSPFQPPVKIRRQVPFQPSVKMTQSPFQPPVKIRRQVPFQPPVKIRRQSPFQPPVKMTQSPFQPPVPVKISQAQFQAKVNMTQPITRIPPIYEERQFKR